MLLQRMQTKSEGTKTGSSAMAEVVVGVHEVDEDEEGSWEITRVDKQKP